MGNLDITNARTADLSGVSNFEVSPQQTDGVGNQKETYYDNPNFTTYFGYYKSIPELKKAIDALAMWVLGKGYTTDKGTEIKLSYIDGWGEDTFKSILWNMLVIKKINGDAFAEIIRDPETGKLINLKPLDPASMRIVVNRNGRIMRYEQRAKTKDGSPTKYSVNQILHISNDRVADEIHGTSVIEACKWVIDARNEAMADWRRIAHRATIRVLYIEEDKPTKLATIQSNYKDAIEKGELLILPGKPGEADFKELNLPPHEAFMAWIKYLENFFYQALGVPKVMLGGSEEFTEASSKIGYLTFEQVYMNEIVELEADLWNQMGVKIKFNKPASLRNEMLDSEDKNTGQVGFQPNDTTAGSGKA